MLNGKKKITAFGPKNSRIEFSMLSLKTPILKAKLRQYMVETWGKNLVLTDVENININGLYAETGTGWSADKLTQIRLVVILGNTSEIYRFAFITPPTETQRLALDLRRATYSFRLITEKEAALVKPLRIKLIEVEKNDTIDKLIKQMEVTNSYFRKDWFYLLNNLTPNEPIHPKQKLKIVSRHN
jgi:predicted Zn-dependent protease